MTSVPERHRNKWGCNEVNRLHNEYEIKQLTIQEIASLHKRTIYSILYKLESEELISSWDEARGTGSALALNLENASDLQEEEEDDNISEDDSETDSDIPELLESESESLAVENYIYMLEEKIKFMDSFLKKKFGKEYIRPTTDCCIRL